MDCLDTWSCRHDCQKATCELHPNYEPNEQPKPRKRRDKAEVDFKFAVAGQRPLD
jgi:hypothetical protein